MISFSDRKSATDYASEKEEQGYRAKVRQDNNGIFTVDLRGNRRDVNQQHNPNDLSALREKDEQLEAVRFASGGSKGGKFIRNVGRSFGDIGKSLASPENRRRMRISQMPGRRAAIAQVSNGPNPISGNGAGLHHHHISLAPRRED